MKNNVFSPVLILVIVFVFTLSLSAQQQLTIKKPIVKKNQGLLQPDSDIQKIQKMEADKNRRLQRKSRLESSRRQKAKINRKRVLEHEGGIRKNQNKEIQNELLNEDVSTLKRMGIWNKLRRYYPVQSFKQTGDQSPIKIAATITESEPNDDYTTANPMAYEDLVENATINPAGDMDYFSFAGTAGDIVTIEVTAKRLDPPSELDSYIFLYDTDGVTEIAQNDDYYGQDSYILNCELPSTGTFYIKVEDWANVAGYGPDGGENHYYNLFLTNVEVPTYNVSGTVTRQDNGDPIGSTNVQLINGDYPYGEIVRIPTDTDGNYEISGTPAGSYYVRANGWAEVEPDVWEQIYIPEYYYESPNREGATLVDVADDVPGINFTLEEGGYISGIVTDESGNPIESARVNVYDYHTDNYIKRRFTGPDGTFRIPGLNSGDYKVRANADGYLTEFFDDVLNMEDAALVPVTAPDETENINFALELGGSISGVVTDDSGNPIPDAWVWADSYYDGYYAGGDHADENGEYTIVGLKTGYYRVMIEVEGYVKKFYDDALVFEDAFPVAVTAPAETPNINFELPPAGIITGTVTDESGNPISDFWLDVYNVDLDKWGVGFWRSESDGTYKIDGLVSGNYKVWVDAEDYMGEYYDNKLNWDDADIVIVTAPNETGGIDFQLAQGGSISGIVTDDLGNPIEDAWVWADLWDGGYGNGANTQTDGSYLITGLQEGSYRVEVQAEGYVREFYDDAIAWDDASPVEVTIPNETSGINFELPPAGSITGVVTDEDGNQLNNYWLDAYNVDLDIWGVGFWRTQSDGSYKIDGLPSGNYKVWADAEELVGEWYDDELFFEDAAVIGVTAPDETGGIDFQLAEGGTITGIVRDELGNPIGYAEVSANLYDNGWGQGTQSRSDGTYTIRGLVSGDYRVEAWKEGYPRQYWDHISRWEDATRVPVNAPDETSDINFDLIPTTTLIIAYDFIGVSFSCVKDMIDDFSLGSIVPIQ